MKKLNKFCAILCAVLGVQALSAQTDVTSQYLTNADFSSTNGWTAYVSSQYKDYGNGQIGGKLANYAASTVDATHLNSEYFFGFQCRWSGNYSSYNQETSLPAGVYTLSYDVQNVNSSTTSATYNNLFYVKVGDKTYTDASTEWMKGKSSWTSHSISFVLMQESNATISLGYGTGSNNLGSGNCPVLYVSHLKLSRSAFDEVTAENPVDLTSAIVNPSFETNNLNGWTVGGYSSDTGVKPNSNGTYTTSGVDGSYLYNTWWQGTPLTQTVANIPNGIYEMKVLLASDNNAKLFLLANGEHSEVYTITTDNKVFHDVSYEFKVLNGQATIGVVGGNDAGEYVAAGHWWYKADNFRLFYKGADISIEMEALEANLVTAKAVDLSSIPAVVADLLTAAISAAENVEQNLNAIKAATNSLIAALNVVNEVQVPYAAAKELITECNGMLANSTAADADKGSFQSVVDKATDDLEKVTAADAVDTIMESLHNAQKTYCLVATPDEGHPFDMTFLIVNPNFDQDKTGWTSEGGAQNKAIASNKPEPITGKFYENWNPSNFEGKIHQTISGLPGGVYKLRAAAFGNNAVLYANDAQVTMADNGNEPAWYEVETTVTGGVLTFGVSNNNNTGWMGIDNVSLMYLSGLGLSEYITAYNDAYEAAVMARDNSDYEIVTGVERANLLAAIAQTPDKNDQASLEAATSALILATTAYTGAFVDYQKLIAEKVVAQNLGMSESLIAEATSAAKTGALAYTDLKVAEYTYIVKNTYTEEVAVGTWSENFGSDLNGEGYYPNGVTYFDQWGSGTFTAKQTMTLPAGEYAISCIGRGQEGTSGYIYYMIGGETYTTHYAMKGSYGRGVDVNGEANFSEIGTYGRDDNSGYGWEYRFITFTLTEETEVEFGVSGTVSAQWVSFYAPKLLTTQNAQKTILLEEISSLLANLPTGKMNEDVKAALDEKADAARLVNDGTDFDVLNEVARELRDAVDAANASIAAYELINRYIAKANTIDASIAAGYLAQYENGTLTADDAVTVFQSLEVATYRYVTDAFSYPVELEAGAWVAEGPVGSLTGQHYDGTGSSSYLEQSGSAWSSSAWSISYKQTKTLPAGDYVFKVAGRRASGTGNTMSLVVTNVNNSEQLGFVNDFPEGDTGLGINLNGEASFDAGDEVGFTNNNNGRGWQWRYVKFTLTSETTVEIAVTAEATTSYQWISFCDATLQMTEETYLEANMDALDAPTAAANELVNAVPMGAAEKAALNQALNLPVTTGEQLHAKIDALKAAVTNANNWVVAYNEAKAPLLAALERFEADFNFDGDHAHMANSAWANVLDKVQAAAVAKDVTDSYDGFALAAAELNEALDAAQASIDMYAVLNDAINNAKSRASANVGDGAFQKPQSAVNVLGIANAQDVYDAATADVDGVTAAIEALNETIVAFDNVALNNPAAGEVFNIVLNNNGGWEHDGKAVTYIENGRNDAGMYNIQYLTVVNVNYAQAFTFTPVADMPNHYTLSMTDVDGNERYVCTGTVYGGNTAQIRTTTDATKALAVKVIATATEGVWNLYNTEANQYIGSQDAGFFTVNSHTNFNLVAAEKAEVTLNISAAGWATLILPFNAELPEGVKAYSCGEADGEVLTLEEAGSIVANTPYLIGGVAGAYDFSGYGLAKQDSYKVGLFNGTYVDYQTEADANTYVLQKHGDEVAFYLVGDSKQPVVGAYRCYMTYEKAAGAPMFSFGRGEGTTAIDNAQSAVDAPVIYDLMGRKVSAMEKGNMYIVNGQKVVVK